VRRRHFFEHLAGAAVVTACGPALRAPAHAALAPRAVGGVRAVAFDLLTIFDPRGVERRVAALVGENPAFAKTWKTRLFEYCWLRSAAGQYVDFDHLVRDSLVHAAEAHRVSMTDGVRAQLEASFTELSPWPDAPAALRDLRARGLRLAPLANFTPRAIEALVARAGLRDVFEALLSTDQARTYKPDPRAYALAETSFGLPRAEIAFAAFGGWDTAGARWYGYPTFWVNRLGATPEQLVAADASGPDLEHLVTWVSTR